MKHRLDEAKFASIKSLMAAGLNGSQVAKYLGYSDALVYTVNKFPTLITYLQYNRDRLKQYQIKKGITTVISKQNIPAPVTQILPSDRMISLLISINNNLQVLIDQTKSTPKARPGFWGK